MTKQEEYDAIMQNMVYFPDGASSEEIRIAMKWPVSHVHTMQRRLASLVKENRLFLEGASRARRYRLANSPTTTSNMTIVRKNEFAIPLSTEAENIRERVLEPIHLRLPVGYNREFIDQYRPNKTNYLSDITRRHLLDIGGFHGDLPAGTYARQILNRLLIDLSWNSSRLEGDTYSLLETERLLNLRRLSKEKT